MFSWSFVSSSVSGLDTSQCFFKSRDFYRISLFTISVYALFHAGSDIAFESVIVLIRISQWAVISIRILANLAIRSAKNRLTKATSSRF